MSQRSVRRVTQVSYVRSEGGGSGTTVSLSDSGPSLLMATSPDSSTGTTTSFSPTCMTRMQEKNALQELNDRLASYIDRVRTLESENKRLGVIIRNSEEVVTRERNSLRSAYEKELGEARRMCDELSHEKSRLQMENGRQLATIDDLKKRLATLERDLRDKNSRIGVLESQLSDLTTRLNGADQTKRSKEVELLRVQEEADQLRQQLVGMEKKLEEETLGRLDFENKVASLREELTFIRQLHDKELEETRRKRQVEITEMNQELKDEYKQKLQEALTAMREQLDGTIKANRREVEAMYEAKLQTLRDMADSNRDTSATAHEEVKRMTGQISFLEGQRSKLTDDLAELEKKYNDLLARNSQLKEEMYSRLSFKDEEIRRVKKENEEMMKDYKDLMDTKIMLTMEIEAYRRMLEGEEARLNLTPTPMPQDAESPGGKRRRIYQERESEIYATYRTHSDNISDVRIMDHDLDGSFVKILNGSNKDIPIGGWAVKRTASGMEVMYKFHAKMVLRPNQPVTIWSCDSGAKSSPPHDLVMKQQQWPTGTRIRTSLVNANDEEVAWRESEKESMSERTTFRSNPFESSGHVDVEKRCSVM